MNYRIKREDQEFGPYTLAELQTYCQSGHIKASDLAQSEGMDSWVPVSQILGDIPIPVISPINTSPAEPVMPLVDLMPNLGWGWLLLINLLTRYFFNFIWALVQANWARKLNGKNNALVLVCMYPAGMICGFVAVIVGTSQELPLINALGFLMIIGGALCLLFGSFSIRSAMEEYYNTVEDINLSLSGGMTFFFSTIYLQYHVNRIARWKKTGVLS